MDENKIRQTEIVGDDNSSDWEMDPFDDQLESKDGILVTDESNRIIVMNQAIEKIGMVPHPVLKSRNFIKVMNYSAGLSKNPKEFLEMGLQILKDKSTVFREEIFLNDGKVIDMHTFPMVGADQIIHGRIWYFRDVTEQKRIDDLRNMQALLMENLNEGVALASIPDNIIVYTNPKFEKIFGYDRGELIGKHISILNAPNKWMTPKEISDEIENELKTNNEWGGRILNVKKDGSLIWTFSKVNAFLHSEFGNVWVSLQSDITDHVKMEDELKISEERFRMLFENNIFPMMVITVDGGIIAVNRAAIKLFGRTKDELIEVGRAGVINSADDRWEKLNEERKRTGAYSGRFTIIHKDGYIVEVDATSSTLFDSEGKEQTHILLKEVKEK